VLYAEKIFSRKGAKRYRVSKGFLCAFALFAPLRETFFLPQVISRQKKAADSRITLICG